MRTLTAVIAAATTFLACSSNPARTPVLASPTDISALAGEWAGDYSSAASGRSGSIVFTLKAGQDRARGDVVMIPRGSTQPIRPGARTGESAVSPAASQVLTVSFVRVAGDTVSGTLDPYEAPDCACLLNTTFSGTLRGDTIEGSFTTRGAPNDQPQTGRWKVKRRKS